MIIITAAFAITSCLNFLPFWASKSTTLCPPMFTQKRAQKSTHKDGSGKTWVERSPFYIHLYLINHLITLPYLYHVQ